MNENEEKGFKTCKWNDTFEKQVKRKVIFNILKEKYWLRNKTTFITAKNPAGIFRFTAFCVFLYNIYSTQPLTWYDMIWYKFI